MPKTNARAITKSEREPEIFRSSDLLRVKINNLIPCLIDRHDSGRALTVNLYCKISTHLACPSTDKT